MVDARTETPSNLNFLNPLNFKFQIKKTPTVNYFIQNVNIPGLSLQQVNTSNPFVKIPYGGDHIQFDDIMINFKVDEDLKNYLELYNWIKNMGFPDNFDQYKTLADKPKTDGEGLVSDISLIVISSARNPIFEILFKDAFPVSLSSLIFDSTRPDIEYLECACTFKYTSFDINPI
jgi:hypothetical protein